MRIAGIQKNSFVDYPGKVCAVLFTPGCNMDCFYCHNRMLLSGGERVNLIDMDKVLGFLTKRKGFLEGVVVTGGEPTLQDDLYDFLGTIKGMGYSVKLDTNGTNPRVIESLINKRMVDYIAMDIKAPFEKYEKVCGIKVKIESIKKSISLLKESAVDYEFRTTIAPGLNFDDIIKIANEVSGARLYVLQNYRSINAHDAKDHLKEPSCSPEIILGAAESIKGTIRRVETRGVFFCA
ncbi:MAG: anaerobic ribonucleoside-triphosphate reductase activating protein [Bacillota bacterium]